VSSAEVAAMALAETAISRPENTTDALFMFYPYND
jgi:hypothetical protein